MRVSQFINAKTATGPTNRDVLAIIEEIRTGKYQKVIEELNQLPTDSKEQKEFKTTRLLGITFAGTFEARADDKHLEHSGLVAVDFDHLPDDDYRMHWQLLSNDPHTFALFRSPRRDGIKCITRITADKERHRALVRGLRDFYNSMYYDHFDDPSRLCFVSYDPDLYLNVNAIPWDKEGKENKPVYSATQNNEIPTGKEGDIFRMVLRWQLNRGNTYTDGNKHKFLISVFTALNRFGVGEDTAIEMVTAHFADMPGVEFVNPQDFEQKGRYVYRYYKSEFNTRPFAPHVERPEVPPSYTPSDDPPRPRFPIEVFPENCQRFIIELNRTLKYNTDFCAVAMLFAVGTLNGNKYKLRVKNGWTAPTIFWGMAVGEPGTMKTHPLNSIIRPLSLIDKQNKERYDTEMEEWEHNEKKGPKPKFKQILLSDYTLEALHDVHSYNKRGLGLYKDEIVGFLNDMNKYRKGSDEQFWLESFNNAGYQINRVSKEPIRLDDIMINIIGTIQPAVLSKVIKDYAGNGLVDRFLFTSAEDAIFPMCLDDIDADWFRWWEETMMYANTLFEFSGSQDTVLIEMTQEAKEMMIATDAYFVKLQTSEEETNEIKNYLSKMKTYMPRFALLMALFDSIFNGVPVGVVSEYHFSLARKICEYFIASARTLFNEAEKTDEIESVRRAMATGTKAEQILMLVGKGYRNKEVAKLLKTSPQYVSDIIKSSKSSVKVLESSGDVIQQKNGKILPFS